MDRILENKVAIVTGASSGMGEATALDLAKEGARVVITARRSEKLAEVEKRIMDNHGTCLSLPLDVTDEEAVKRCIQKVEDTWGTIDILINNAGVMLLSPIDEADTADWRRMLDTNLLGLLLMTRYVLPSMKEQRSGHIVNVSSVAGRTAGPTRSVYNATKWGVVGFSEALRQEVVGYNIRTTIIEPGIVATELQDHIPHETTKENLKKWIQTSYPLQSEDISAAIIYALSQPSHVNVNEILIRPTEQEK